MRMLHLYELDGTDHKRTKVIAATKQAHSNAGIRNLYNYLRSNGNNPYMIELPGGDIRIQYFCKRSDNQ